MVRKGSIWSSEAATKGAFLTSHCQKLSCPYKTDIGLVFVLSVGLYSYYWQLPVEC
jgi:hypothetical protein